MTPTAGDALPVRRFAPLTRTDFVRYQGASGDFNPIHHDEESARAAGFPTVFSVGMLQAGYLASYVTDTFGPAAIRRFKVQFREQVWPGDILVCSGIIMSVSPDVDTQDSLVELKLEVTTDKGATAIKGSAIVSV